MNLVIDDTPVETSAENIAHAVRQGVEHAKSAGRVVTSILLDGEPVHDVTQTAGTRGTLVIETRPPQELTATTARQAVAALESARELQEQVVELLDRGQRVEAIDQLSEIFDHWQAAQQTLNLGAALTGIDLDTFQASAAGGTVHADQAVAQLATTLEAVRNAIQNEDDSALSDTLGGDLLPCIDQWQALLMMLASVAEA
ncbi:MAG: hypothetical protein AAF108_06955 [Planctomycetota bacterium]